LATGEAPVSPGRLEPPDLDLDRSLSPFSFSLEADRDLESVRAFLASLSLLPPLLGDLLSWPLLDLDLDLEPALELALGDLEPALESALGDLEPAFGDLDFSSFTFLLRLLDLLLDLEDFLALLDLLLDLESFLLDLDRLLDLEDFLLDLDRDLDLDLDSFLLDLDLLLDLEVFLLPPLLDLERRDLDLERRDLERLLLLLLLLDLLLLLLLPPPLGDSCRIGTVVILESKI